MCMLGNTDFPTGFDDFDLLLILAVHNQLYACWDQGKHRASSV